MVTFTEEIEFSAFHFFFSNYLNTWIMYCYFKELPVIFVAHFALFFLAQYHSSSTIRTPYICIMKENDGVSEVGKEEWEN